ncbi:class I SAM-dependent methyltransferase [Hymenobacter sp. H14-R3]|uniref:class I SAM-dependent methyltransferase n=1 Tax=Hymenobacter sp. H14-R3 TaxID=3046308 RepID=UPI0024B8E1BC|nr:class I SAM-dependent methyltransferase [Hymenobacter sp. H14-R3]MDJ0363884.1 class I SAM-dependent methyltransferase [Hymenobacter sp. H14-R3]
MPSRLTIALRALAALARTPALLTEVLAADVPAWRARALAHAGRWPGLAGGGLPLVPFAHFVPPTAPLTARTVAPFAFGDGGSLPTDLLLLRALARQHPACRYFEIGTWRGESAANVAAEATSVHTLNLSPAEMRALKLPERYIELHGHFSQPLPHVVHLHGNSATFDLAGLQREAGPFDLVFIDGDHRYEAVRRDTARVFEYLVSTSTTVVWHDASRQPGQPRWEVLAGLLDGLPPGLPGQLVQVGNTLCALYSPQPLPAQAPDPLADPGQFTVEIRM